MKTLVTLFVLSITVLSVSAQDRPKYGHCDVMEVWENMPEKLAIEEELGKIEARHRQDLRAMMEEYEAGMDVGPEKWRTWSNEKRDSATHAWQRMEERIVRYRDRMERTIGEKEAALLGPVRQRIRSAVRSVAEAEGFAYIFDSSTEEVLHAGGGNDITEDVIARLDAKNRKTARP